MSELKLQKVFLPVSVEDELPILNTFYLCIVEPSKFDTNNQAECFFDATSKVWVISPNDRFIEVTHWLKEQEGYFMSADEFAAQQTYIQNLESALDGLIKDVESKPNDTRYATHLKIAKQILQSNK